MYTLHLTKNIFLFYLIISLFGCSNQKQQMYGLQNPADPGYASLEEKLKKHVIHLSETIGIRNITRFEALEQAAEYLEEELKAMGYNGTNLTVIPYTATYTGEGFKEDYDKGKIIKDKPYKMRIIEAVVHSGPDTNINNECIVIGAHYDTVDGSPGADDNASGVAALLEIARHMVKHDGKIETTLKFVLFPNEEEPYSLDSKTTDKKEAAAKYGVDTMGSRVYAKMAKEKHERIKGMIALESIGYFSDEPGSQRFPRLSKSISLAPIFKVIGYTDIGNDVKFIYNWGSQAFANECMSASHNAKDPFPIDRFSAPHCVPIAGRLIERSDHGAFLREGYNGLMITDTADLRNDNYHKETDTIGTVNFSKLSKLVENLKGMTERLGLSKAPLSILEKLFEEETKEEK